jgi:outer membrane protein OmpA-like peptidoglycan-associated protein
MRLLYILLFIPVFYVPAVAQDFKIQDFRLAGEAIRTGSDCILLSPDKVWSSGSIWHKHPISLRAQFEVSIKFMIGCKNEQGADGLVFVLHPHSRQTGFQGEGMGFAGLTPSLGIEIDTWRNEHLGDPYEDHVSILKNGNVSHWNNLAGPIRLQNLEDCRQHILTIKWSPESNMLTIIIDRRKVLQYRGNLRQQIFNGVDQLYWGITAATGAFSNRQEICFEKLTYTLSEDIAPLELSGEKKQALIEGESVILSKLKFETGSTTILNRSKAELDELATILQQAKGKRLDIFGHTDSQGSKENNSKLSKKRALAIARYLESKGVDPSILNPRGYGEEYPIAPNNTPDGRSKNRRIEFRLLPYYP